MDVTTISNAATQNLGQIVATNKNAAAKSAYGAYSTTAQQTESATSSIGNAFEVDISDEAKQAAAQAEETVQSETSETKGLSANQIQSLKDDIAMQEQTMLNLMIQVLTEHNDKLQGWINNGGISTFGGKQIDSSLFSIPEVATNPEDAAKAVADGGDWSVGAVSDRIFKLAEAFAGGDPEKLEEMRAAVEEGFRQAGVQWNSMTGNSSMPDITSQTYNELMHRFDTTMQKLTSGTIE